MSYGTLAEADTYFELTYTAEADWFTFTDEQKEAALLRGQRAIDRLRFNTDDEKPPVDELGEPLNDIKNANFELAATILLGADLESEIHAQTMTQHRFGDAHSQHNTRDAHEHIVNGILSYEAWLYLLPYLSHVRGITIYKV